MDRMLVKKLLGRIGIPDQFSIESVAGGMNNKVFCVSTNDRKFLLKCYRPPILVFTMLSLPAVANCILSILNMLVGTIQAKRFAISSVNRSSRCR